MKLFSLKNIPLTVIIGFNLFTLFVFCTAPINWKTDYLYFFLGFAFLCQFLIIAGYQIGYAKFNRRDVSKKALFAFSRKKLNAVFWFYSLTFLIKYAYLVKTKLFDIKAMVTVLALGVADPHFGYRLALDSSVPYTVSWTIFFAISIVNNLFFIIGFCKWKSMNRFKKYLFVFFVLLEMFYWFGRGTNFGVITLVTTFLFVLMYRLKSINFNFKQKVTLSLLVVFLFCTSIAVFSLNMTGRRGGAELSYDQFDVGKSYVDENSLVFSIIPEPLHDTYMYMVSYLTQGYYNTCVAFELDYQPSYFLGNNPSVEQIATIFNVDVYKKTYVYRLKDKGIDPEVSWHSAYLWYANDVTFFGVPVLLFFMGYLFGASWTLSLNHNDFLSKIMFVILANMLLFLFANNSYLGSVFYSLMFLLPFWILSRISRIKWT